MLNQKLKEVHINNLYIETNKKNPTSLYFTYRLKIKYKLKKFMKSDKVK